MDKIIIYEVSPSGLNKIKRRWNNLEEIENELYLAKRKDKYIAVDVDDADYYKEKFNKIEQALLWLVNKDLIAEDIKIMQDIEVIKDLERFDYKVDNIKIMNL